MSSSSNVDPVSQAFKEVLEEIYWQESLEEAEKRLEEFIASMDEDLRELLLEKRREYCSNPEAVVSILSLEALLSSEDLKDVEQEYKQAMIAKAMINAAFLIQCTPTWSELTPDEKAWVLAPLYKASYGIELALKGDAIDKLHLNHALEMLEIALARAEMLGLVEEMREHIEMMAERLFEESGSPHSGP
ncbi:hypothetical protein APE_2288 [Aeropyrum pernix K1]|uniref:Uncharacterized protein n=1 Tax=Aeropyrum pernix (strain ATCC 700893 / DSM 11879 / JCM 9820 / NBRC 100138 / K1) TaxID=272557 RepID=Q9Y9K0_AERPE|nr:hypothetical protein [Aeropyrum pernix]BAA81300.1 hypothetical protein APE_2288 [Aeropyrum pernix K1]